MGDGAGWLMAMRWPRACHSPTAPSRADELRSSLRDPGQRLRPAALGYQASKASLPGEPGRHQI